MTSRAEGIQIEERSMTLEICIAINNEEGAPSYAARLSQLHNNAMRSCTCLVADSMGGLCPGRGDIKVYHRRDLSYFIEYYNPNDVLFFLLRLYFHSPLSSINLTNNINNFE